MTSSLYFKILNNVLYKNINNFNSLSITFTLNVSLFSCLRQNNDLCCTHVISME